MCLLGLLLLSLVRKWRSVQAPTSASPSHSNWDYHHVFPWWFTWPVSIQELIQDLRSSSSSPSPPFQTVKRRCSRVGDILQQVCQTSKPGNLVRQRIHSDAKFRKHKRTDVEVKPQSLARAARNQGQTILQARFHISRAGLKFDDVTHHTV